VQRIHFVAGLPRSGSTLLQNLLGQNPRHHVTPTSGVVDLVAGVRDAWPKNVSMRGQGLEKMRPRIEQGLRGLIEGFYMRELAEDRIVFDKSRGWPAYLELLDAAFGEPQRILLTMRDVRAVLASFEKLHRKNPVVRQGIGGDAFVQAQTAEGRAQLLLAPGGVVGLAINRVRDLLQRGLGERAVVVPYRQLTQNPQEILGALHATLGLPAFTYDPKNVEQITHEDDDLHGWGDLHTIRAYVQPPEVAPWKGVLPDAFCDRVANEYSDINELSK
jgi:sulfotransferase